MNKGFTLAELLVVVAIIALLAAMAIPNLLDAQVRSRVSRARADMRAMAVALDAYAVDHNRFPTFHYQSPQPGSPDAGFFLGGQAGPGVYYDTGFSGNPQLTTPVAYLSTVPRDPFFSVRGDDVGERDQFLYVNWRYAGERRVLEVPLFFQLAVQFFGDWHLMSGGPTGSRAMLPAGANHYLSFYDPTNGTVSPGLIQRTALHPTGRPVGI